MTSAWAMGDGDRLKTRAVAAPANLDRAPPTRIRASGARSSPAAATSPPPALLWPAGCWSRQPD